MKILIASHRAYPVLGGLERHIYKFAKNITDRDKDFVVLNLAFSKDNSDELKVSPNFLIKTIKAPFIFTDAYPIPLMSAIRYYNEISRFKPNVIHTHGRYFASTVMAYLYAARHNIPLVHTEHISGDIFFKNRFISAIVNFVTDTFANLLFKRANAVTAVSKVAVEFLTKKYKVKVDYVANFIDPEELSSINPYNQTKTSLKEFLFKKVANFLQCNDDELANLRTIFDNRKTVLFPYRLVTSKGYKKVINLAEQNKNFLFLIAGSGEGEAEVINAQERLLNLIFLGKLDHQNLLECLKSVDFFINLSHQEGLSTTILEALHYNTSIIATDIPENRFLNDYRKVWFLHMPAVGTSEDQNVLDELVNHENLGNFDGPQIITNLKATLAVTSESYKSLYLKFKAEKHG